MYGRAPCRRLRSHFTFQVDFQSTVARNICGELKQQVACHLYVFRVEGLPPGKYNMIVLKSLDITALEVDDPVCDIVTG